MDKLFTMPHPLYKIGDIVVVGLDTCRGYVQETITAAIYRTDDRKWHYVFKNKEEACEASILYKI